MSPGSTERRRTPGLRREEVAARAGVSVTWYTWLEQGRGGVPSGDVLERLARALELDDANREMLFLLAHDRPPPRRAPRAPAEVTPALQRVLDNLLAPAFVTTPTFQIVGWNRAALAVLGDYRALPERDRNMLRRVFHPDAPATMAHADDIRRRCVAAFRVDIARAGATEEATALVDELLEASPDFRRLWANPEVRAHGVTQKVLVRPGVGELQLETSVFAVDGADGLSLFVFAPADEASARGIAQLVSELRA